MKSFTFRFESATLPAMRANQEESNLKRKARTLGYIIFLSGSSLTGGLLSPYLITPKPVQSQTDSQVERRLDAIEIELRAIRRESLELQNRVEYLERRRGIDQK